MSESRTKIREARRGLTSFKDGGQVEVDLGVDGCELVGGPEGSNVEERSAPPDYLSSSERQRLTEGA